jgi:hypothetical protein
MLFGIRFAICIMTVNHLVTHFTARYNTTSLVYSGARTQREAEEFWAFSTDQLIRSIITGTEPHMKKSVYFMEPKSIS